MERTKHLAIATSGVHVGTFVTMGVSGVVAEHLGWPWIFYIFGIYFASNQLTLKFNQMAFVLHENEAARPYCGG